MRTIPLSQGKVALVDDADYEWLGRFKWYVVKNGYTYYAARWPNMRMHRVILNAPDGLEVDHIDGNGLNNQQSNLRICTNGENGRHQRLRCDSKTGFKGVTLDRRKLHKPYRVLIQLNNKRIRLGYYLTAELAAQAYDIAARKYHGKFALTNRMLGLL